MTRDEAEKLIGIIPSSVFVRQTGYGGVAVDDFADRLRATYPEFNWRIILDRSGERTHWRLTIDDNDPREHYVPVGGVCVHCGKTATELGVEERSEED